MTFEERMQQLGRRALEQEPYEFALPRFIRAAECVKPISCVNYRVERHGCFEGRLPIPDTVICDNTNESQGASRSKLRKKHGSASRSSQPHKAPGGTLLTSSQLEAQKQLDAIKAHKKAAKAYSESVERRNSRMLQRDRLSNSRHGAARRSTPSACDSHNQPGTTQRHPGIAQPLAERHIPPRTSTGGMAGDKPPLGPPAHQQCGANTAHAAAPAGHQPRRHPAHTVEAAVEPAAGACEDSTVTAGAAAAEHSTVTECAATERAGHAMSAVAAEVPAGSCFEACRSDEAVHALHPVPCRHTRLINDQPDLQAVSPHPSSGLALNSQPMPGATASHLQGGASSESVSPTCITVQCLDSHDGAAHRHAQPACTMRHPSECVAVTKTSAAAVMEPARPITASALASTTPSARGAVTQVAADTADTQAAACLDSNSASSRLLHLASQMKPVQQTTAWTLSSPSGAAAAASEVVHQPADPPHAGKEDDQAFISAQCTCGGTARGVGHEAAGGGSCGAADVGGQALPQTHTPSTCPSSGCWFVEEEPMQQAPLVAPLCSSQQNQQQHTQGAALPAAEPPLIQPPASVRVVRLPWQAVKGRASISSRQASAQPTSRRASVSCVGEKSVAQVLKGAAAGERCSNAAPAAFSSPELVRLAAAAAEKVANRQLVLPALCSCGHGTSVLDAAYTKQCCTNCPLRCGKAAYEQLLTGLLSAMGVA